MNNSDKAYKEKNLVSIWFQRFNEAMIVKAPYTKRWMDYIDAYNGDLFKKSNLPDYKSNVVSNYIFSIIETIRPIMLDNNPKFLAMPRSPQGMKFSNDVQQVMSFEWDREKMNTKLSRQLVNVLVTGNAPFFIPWDSDKKQVSAIPTSAFNIFPDPLATCIDDADYIIYAHYVHVNKLKQSYPEKKDELVGGAVKHTELVHENGKNAKIDNQVLVLEVYTRNLEDDNERVGLPVKDYPNGRVLTMCPELGILLEDKASIYKDSPIPFVIIKDYDVPGKFWGEGEVTQLLSPQIAMDELSNSVLDNAKATANMPWIIDKNSGIGVGKITNRPGLVIRKNPGSEVRREVPPSMPAYISQSIDTYKRALEEISGVFNSVKGTTESGVYTAQGQLSLVEQGTTRIRLKVKVMESALADICMMWFSRIKQFWKEDKFIVVSRSDGDYDLKKFMRSSLKYDYDIRLTAGSTMPANRSAMLDLMLRLAQVQMPDGQPLVDREAVVHYLPEEVRSAIMKRMGDKHVVLEQLQQEVQQVVESMQQGFEQVTQQLEEVSQQSQSADDEAMGIIEEITTALEKINKELGIVKEDSESAKKEQEALEQEEQMRDRFYNEGYKDAEKFYSQASPADLEEMGEVPESVLSALENMSDEELSMLAQDNPQLFDMLK